MQKTWYLYPLSQNQKVACQKFRFIIAKTSSTLLVTILTNRRKHPGVPFVRRQGVLFSSDFDNVDRLCVYHTKDYLGGLGISFSHYLYLYDEECQTLSLERLQGGGFSRNGSLLYLVSDNGSDGGIFIFNPMTGRMIKRIPVDYSRYLGEELEGIAVIDAEAYKMPGIEGQIHMVMIDNEGVGDMGDIDWFNGYIFVPFSGGRKLVIALFSASDLEMKSYVILEDLSDIGWCAVQPHTGVLVTSNSSINRENPVHLYQINLSLLESDVLSLEPIGTKAFAKPNGEIIEMCCMQGVTFIPDGSMLYLIKGHFDDNRTNGGIRLFDFSSGILLARSRNGSGSFNFAYDVGAPYEEPEGITYWDLDAKSAPGIKGQLHAFMLDNEWSTDDIYLKHYRVYFDEEYQPPMRGKYKANRSKDKREVHTADCSWADNIALKNEIWYSTVGEALEDGYDGCAHCLKKYHQR